MPAAVIGGAIAAVGAVGSAAIGSSAQSRASREATQATQQATAANNALQREIYGQNRDMLTPYVQRGNAAGNQMNALLGLGGGTTTNSAGSAFILKPKNLRYLPVVLSKPTPQNVQLSYAPKNIDLPNPFSSLATNGLSSL